METSLVSRREKKKLAVERMRANFANDILEMCNNIFRQLYISKKIQRLYQIMLLWVADSEHDVISEPHLAKPFFHRAAVSFSPDSSLWHSCLHRRAAWREERWSNFSCAQTDKKKTLQSIGGVSDWWYESLTFTYLTVLLSLSCFVVKLIYLPIQIQQETTNMQLPALALKRVLPPLI